MPSGPGQIFYPGETIAPLLKGDPFLGQLPGEPLPAVEAHLDGQGKPGLQPGAHKTELGMKEIVIEVQTLAAMRPDLEPLGFPVPVNLKGLTGLDTGKDTDQPVCKVIPGGYFSSQVFFANLTGSQISDGAAGAPGRGQGGLLEASSHLEDVLAKVFQEHPQKGQAIVHALGIEQPAQSAPED